MTKMLKPPSLTAASWTAAAVGVATLALAVASCGSSGGRQPAGRRVQSVRGRLGRLPRSLRRARKLNARQDPRRRQGPDAVPVPGGQGNSEHVHPRMRERVAAADHHR
jgi:hypothetical protein